MSTFDKDTHFLVLGNKPLVKIIDKYEDSDTYRSYNKYLNKTLRENVDEYLIPSLNKILDGLNIELASHKDSIKIISSKASYRNYKYNDVRLSLVHKEAVNVTMFKKEDVKPGDQAFTIKYEDKVLPAFSLLEIPIMDKSGILRKDNKEYAVINCLSLGDSVTFNGGEIRLINEGRSIIFGGKNKPNVVVSKDKISSLDLIIALAKAKYSENGEVISKRLIEAIRDTAIISSITGTEGDANEIIPTETYEFNLNNAISNRNTQRAIDFRLEEKLEDNFFSTAITRGELNELLSFNNAIGRTLSRDAVDLDNNVVVEKETVIDSYVVSLLNKAKVDTIFVINSKELTGYTLAETRFHPNQIIRGTPIIPEMVELIPELGDYSEAPTDFYFPNGESLTLGTGTLLTKEHSRYFEYIGVESVYVKEKPTSVKMIKMYFEEEFLCNRHYKKTDLGLPIDADESVDSYVFVSEDGTIEAPSDELTCYDAAALLSTYLKLIKGHLIDKMSDPDAGLRKKVEQVEDHFQKAFIYATKQFATSSKNIFKNYVSTDPNTTLSNTDKVNDIFKFFSRNFYTHLQQNLRVLDILDTTNPVATASSLSKINTMVKSADSVGNSMRRITMGHYGRICPYETPQSKKIGVVNNRAIGCRIEDGVMYAKYFKVIKSGDTLKLSSVVEELTVIQEEKFRIAEIGTLDIDWETRTINTKGKVLARVPARNSLEKMTVSSIDISHVQYVNIYPDQFISSSCTTVPFAGADDAARVSFGMSMVKQTKGLVRPDIPRVCPTGFLNIPNSNTYYKIFSEDTGRVVAVNGHQVVIKYDGQSDVVLYEYEPMRINSNSIILRIPTVSVGENVIKGQTIVTSNFIKQGILATGVNAIVALMTDGYNYEDGVPTSTRLSSNLTSYGTHSDTIMVSKREESSAARDLRYGTYLGRDDVMFVKNSKTRNDSTYINQPVRAMKCRGFIARVDAVQDPMFKNKVKEFKARSVSFDRLDGSDKICNRHGNKGVACKIFKNSEMDYLENGEFIDIKYNPTGIISRMNIGQILEAKLGLVCHVLDIHNLCDTFNSPSTDDIKMMLKYTCALANTNDEDAVFAEFPDIPQSLHEYCKSRIDKIRLWRGTFNEDGKAHLINPESGKRSLVPVDIGVIYIYKLVQEGEGKLHSRGGLLSAPYVAKTESPTKGASNGGGQRMGYMELDGYGAYGATALLKEITNERSDNYIARNNLTVKHLHSGDPRYMLDEKNGIRRSSEYFFELLRALGLHLEFTEDELNTKNKDKRKYYKKKTLIDANLDANSTYVDPEQQFSEAFMSLLGGGE